MTEVVLMGHGQLGKTYRDAILYVSLTVGLIILTANFTPGFSHVLRSRRDLIDLAIMTSAKLHQNTMMYINYGTYCGVLGQGKPVDAIDECCQSHDNCYTDIVDHQAGCCFPHNNFSMYWIPYSWSIIKNNTIHCGSSSYLPEMYINCSVCICECDKSLARCLYKNKESFNSSNMHSFLWRMFQSYAQKFTG